MTNSDLFIIKISIELKKTNNFPKYGQQYHAMVTIKEITKHITNFYLYLRVNQI